MSIGNQSEETAAVQDEDEWNSRSEDAVVVLRSEEQQAVTPPASSTGQVETLEENVRAGDLAVLGDACPICLQTLEDPVMLTICYHVYCYECLSTWVHSLALHGVDTATCPLCKSPFRDVYANVRSESDFEVVSFQGIQTQSPASRTREREERDRTRQKVHRRSLVYRRHMRLVRVDEKELDDADAFPMMQKVKGEYEMWLVRELQACIGREIDLTVLLAIIHCCLNKIEQCGVKKCYNELEHALKPFLYEDARQFVRELAFFLGSRLNVEAYDASVKYRCENAAECTTALCCDEF
ncbi:hypothetical protein PsorP6_000651 [Peronosclerospora sorghi]|uniref:Uncharacterized protein n=1 Tax=Peronosclerospora sorghi TaxID=230839 RepID=A0ACC0WTS2_9STRA|nr:hypothetical protein PsorP6_000651 [Peronosclerospora sorghi]